MFHIVQFLFLPMKCVSVVNVPYCLVSFSTNEMCFWVIPKMHFMIIHLYSWWKTLYEVNEHYSWWKTLCDHKQNRKYNDLRIKIKANKSTWGNLARFKSDSHAFLSLSSLPKTPKQLQLIELHIILKPIHQLENFIFFNIVVTSNWTEEIVLSTRKRYICKISLSKRTV